MSQSESNEKIKEQLQESNTYLGLGAGLGAFSAATTLALGATCPLCIVVAPALIGVGAYKRVKAKKAQNAQISGKKSKK